MFLARRRSIPAFGARRLPGLLAAKFVETYDPSIMKAYEEIIEFIASGTTPSNVAAFRPSEKTKERIADLIQREKTSGISPGEESELNHYLQLEHLMRLAKARARQHIVNG